ncbi:hypothetical protein [Candidatus Contubernalis alkaliaceticus]|uniref:hypothetical protein n=1 Tax=Candidatus Contubernalis alkaliaceticus TaxID=338645 RepID=UPI001F4BF6AC|nr:hypothetical protein [Candidatus Contubernalis alkalaceticus]UNC92223.1 hypothetical protein HUE98_09045 [Candidatus Contubernalis alkalaceticus]
MLKLWGVFLDWVIAMIAVFALARVLGYESVNDIGVWRFVVIGSSLFMITQLIRYKITGKVPW